MMSGNIWHYDQYNFRRFKPGDIDCFLDIGGCVGTASVLLRALDPGARVIAIEPCKEDFDLMCVSAGTWGVQCVQIALGDGRPMCFHYRHRGAHRLYTESEKQWWPKDSYMVNSMTLTDMCRHFKIQGRYIIKLDTEGGERFVLRDKGAVDIIRKSIQFNFEYHGKFGGKLSDWNEWVKNFKDTHILYYKTKEREKFKYTFKETDVLLDRWRYEYMLARK